MILQTVELPMNQFRGDTAMAEILDDKAVHVIPFILENLKTFHESLTDREQDQPLFIGLNGVQGAGKSVLVSILLEVLTSKPYNLPTVVFSLDDLYLTHADQVKLAKSHPDNPLLQHRGQPSTHDVPLAMQVFKSLKEGRPTKIPQYDKAAFDGQGDRVPESHWQTVNQDPEHRIRVILFEGWCVGFRSLSGDELRSKHEHAVNSARSANSTYAGRLGHNSLQSVKDINDALKLYDALTDQLDAFIHIDASDPLYVYHWRQQQEEGLREAKGSGMTDDQVKRFVNGYYPAYELYTQALRAGVFKQHDSISNDGSRHKNQLRFVVDENRKIKDVVKM